MFYLGIDQHAKQLTINLARRRKATRFSNDKSARGLRKCWNSSKQLTARCALTPSCSFWAIVEVCGFNEWLIEMLRNFRCERIVLDSAGRFLTPQDRSSRDAAKLSEDAVDVPATGSHPDKLRFNNLKIVNIPNSIQHTTASTNQPCESDTKAAHTKSINRIKHVLRRHNLQHEMPTKYHPDQRPRLAWLKTLQLRPADLLELKLAMQDLGEC